MLRFLCILSYMLMSLYLICVVYNDRRRFSGTYVKLWQLGLFKRAMEQWMNVNYDDCDWFIRILRWRREYAVHCTWTWLVHWMSFYRIWREMLSLIELVIDKTLTYDFNVVAFRIFMIIVYAHNDDTDIFVYYVSCIYKKINIQSKTLI